MCYSQPLPDDDPKGLARPVDEALTRTGIEGVRKEMKSLDEWYDWLHWESET